MTKSYNLLTENWIPVRLTDDTIENIGIKNFFEKADTISDIACDLPTMRFAIFRILFAIFCRSIDEDMEEESASLWKELWDSDSLPIEEINAYLEKHHNRFDLLHPEYPFLQTPSLHTKSGEWKELDIIVADSPGEGALYSQTDPRHPISFAEGARWLIHATQFDYSGIKSGAVGDDRVKGGKGYPMGIGWCGWMGCTIIRGRNMKETLLLNYVPRSNDSSDYGEASDLPIWELPTPQAHKQDGLIATGQLSLIAWPQRRIRLRNNGSSFDGVLVCNGDPVDYLSQLSHETMTPWRFSKPQSSKAKQDIYMPRSLDPGVALWRGLQSLLPYDNRSATVKSVSTPTTTVPAFLPPKTIEVVAQRIGTVLPRNFILNVEVSSMLYGTQSASFLEVVHDKLSFPGLLAVTSEEALRSRALSAVDRAVNGINVLGDFAANVARSETDSKEAPDNARNRAKESAFSLVDPFFRSWLQKLSTDATKAEDQLADWTAWLYHTLRNEARQISHNASPAAWHGRKKDDFSFTLGQSEAWFFSRLRKALPIRPERKETE